MPKIRKRRKGRKVIVSGAQRVSEARQSADADQLPSNCTTTRVLRSQNKSVEGDQIRQEKFGEIHTKQQDGIKLIEVKVKCLHTIKELRRTCKNQGLRFNRNDHARDHPIDATAVPQKFMMDQYYPFRRIDLVPCGHSYCSIGNCCDDKFSQEESNALKFKQDELYDENFSEELSPIPKSAAVMPNDGVTSSDLQLGPLHLATYTSPFNVTASNCSNNYQEIGQNSNSSTV